MAKKVRWDFRANNWRDLETGRFLSFANGCKKLEAIKQ